MAVALVDAGPLVALFDAADQGFERTARAIATAQSSGVRLLTTWPCITEASYLLSPRHHQGMLRWIAEGGIQVYPFESSDLEDMLSWMAAYTEPKKILMDFADASLYWVAVHTGTNLVFTKDQRDFLRYRLPDGRAFEILQ